MSSAYSLRRGKGRSTTRWPRPSEILIVRRCRRHLSIRRGQGAASSRENLGLIVERLGKPFVARRCVSSPSLSPPRLRRGAGLLHTSELLQARERPSSPPC